MSDILPALTANLLGSQEQTFEPKAKYAQDPCGPLPGPNLNSELSVLYPKTENNSIPVMGGSIVKISFSSIDKSEKYLNYVRNLNKSLEDLILSEADKLATKNTSTIRRAINVFLIDSISGSSIVDIAPSLYLSTTISKQEDINQNKEYPEAIVKKSKFSFLPFETIKRLLSGLSVSTDSSGQVNKTKIGDWSGISGSTFFDLYQITNQDESKISEDDISKIIMEVIPFFNISESEILNETNRPSLCGYFTIIGENIYLKMPDFSGFDSAGYGSNYFESSGLNFLIQLIFAYNEKNTYSIKNLFINKQIPIFANITEPITEYDLKSPVEFSFRFESNEMPKSIYLSPAIPEDVPIKNTGVMGLGGISASQSGTFIEFNNYPNPFVSVFDNSIQLVNTTRDLITCKKVDQPYIGTSFSDLKKIKNKFETKFNKNEKNKGIFWPYIERIHSDAPILNTGEEEYFKIGFPFEQEFFESRSGVLDQSITTYEYVGGISRQNIIMHRGVEADSVIEEYSGFKKNNAKYFKKEFISNSTGLCENHRPRVFTGPEAFIPSTWIKSDSIEKKENEYIVKFKISDILKFYSVSASDLKFVVYAFDGKHQLSKVQNGYLKIEKEAPEILSIKPSGTLPDGKIISCSETILDTPTETNKLTINTLSAQSIDSIIIKSEGLLSRSLTIKNTNDSNWIVSGTTITFTLPCNERIQSGTVSIKVAIGKVESAEKYIYVSNGYSTQDRVTEVSNLPIDISGATNLTTEEVSPENMFISSNPFGIPISYSDFRSKIRIKSKKKAFKDSRDIYLYLGFETNDLAKKFSNSIAEVINDGNKIFVAKDFSYKLSASPTSDFYRESSKNANLYFPGNSHSQKPLSILASEASKAYFIISSEDSGNFSGTGNISVLKLGSDNKPAFVAPPLIIGMAAAYSDSQKINHFNNFQNGSIYKEIANKILKSEISGIEGKDSLVVKHKIDKLVILFKYRDIVKFKKRDFDLYIKDEKIGGLFSQFGVRRASDLDGLTDTELFYAKDLYYFISKDIDITTDKSPSVRVEIYDRDFFVNNTTKNKYTDLSIRIPSSKISLSTNLDGGSIFINSNDIIISDKKDAYGNSFSGGRGLFGSYESELALSGFFAAGTTSNLISFSGYPSVVLKSSLSGIVSAVSPTSTDDVLINLSKNNESEQISLLPYSYFTVSNGAEVYPGEFLTGAEEYLIFARIQVDNICKISVLQPEILTVSQTSLVSPGDRVIMTVKNILPYFKVEILGKRAKIASVKKVTLNKSEVELIVPENVLTFDKKDCNIILYNGNQILNKGELDLGYRLSEELSLIAAGSLSSTTNQFDKYKDKYSNSPLKFVSSNLDANIIKDFLTNFCNVSFHATAELNLSLQGFKQLLVPVKVIFCIIDVICNLFNPFQLPLAIIRLFECLYDLVLLLPQVSVPVMLFSLLIHILGLLECLIAKILNFIVIIGLTIDAIMIIWEADKVSFRELLVLEEMLTKYVISLEADLEVMTPIVQILSIFGQLLQLTFRFPCSISPGSQDTPCGINGFEVGSMVSGLVATQTGSAPNVRYNFETKYMIPICQPFTKKSPETISPPSYSYAVQPSRVATEVVFDESTYIDGNYFENNYFNKKTLRKKDYSFDPDTGSINDVDSDTYVSLAASYTKRKKTLESTQSVIFKFSERTWKSSFPIFDLQLIDETKSFDVPISLLEKDGNNLRTTLANEPGNFFSLLDGKSLVSISMDESGNYYGTVKPLKLGITQNGIEIERTFDTIPSMVILDENFNTYYVEDRGIIFDTYNQTNGVEVLGIREIRATIINQKSSTPESFAKEEEVTGTDGDGNPISQDIFSLPQLYFVDTRVAADIIQTKCQTASINQLPLDIVGPADTCSEEVNKLTNCINDFITSIKSQTSSIKNSLAVGSVPSKISQSDVEASYSQLINCVQDGISNICSLVINPLNTSFKLTDDNNLNQVLPDTSLPSEVLSGFEADGPPLTGAREFAAGIGDNADILTGNSANVVIIPRDSYDNIITYNISDKINIEIISDTTQSAELILYPTSENNQNYLIYDASDGSYSAKIKALNPGQVKIKATICNKNIEAITYSDISSDFEISNDNVVDCVPSSPTIQPEGANIPLGILSRINRVLTINFTNESIIGGIGSDSPGVDYAENILSNSQEFGTGLEN